MSVARHSSGKSNYAVSGNVIVAGVVILALIAGLVWWFGLRGNSDDETQAQECIQGDLVLPVAEAQGVAARALINQWNETNPVVRDYCVSAELVDSVDDAAVFIATDNPRTTELLGDRGVSSTVPVDVWTAQLWTADEAAALDDVDPADVSYPVATDPDTAVAVAVALAADQAPALIARDREVSIQDDAEILAVGPTAGIHKGLGVTPLDVAGAEVVAFAYILNPTGDITEEQARAAAAFAAFHDATAEVPAELPDRTAAWAAVTAPAPANVVVEETPEAEAPAPAPDTPVDTLLLLDTSAGTADAFGDRSIYAASATALGPIARDLGAGGQQVALWNYSSPINPGVTQGWRRNVNFSDGDKAADAVLRFGTAGVPQTRSAVVAAVANAADRSRETGAPARVLLVTTGTERDMGDSAFTQAFAEALGGADVSVEVVHVGDREIDGALAGVTRHTQVTDPAQLDPTLRAAAGL